MADYLIDPADRHLVAWTAFYATAALCALATMSLGRRAWAPVLGAVLFAPTLVMLPFAEPSLGAPGDFFLDVMLPLAMTAGLAGGLLGVAAGAPLRWLWFRLRCRRT